MKQRCVLLFLYLFLGLLAGSLITHLLAPVDALSFLTDSLEITWHPQGNFDFLKYELAITVKISLLGIIGMIAGIWIYKKTR